MPRAKLTAANVRTLPAAAGRRTDYYDTIQRGLVLRVTPAGGRVWVFKYSVAGRNRRYRLGPLEGLGVAEAREAARAAFVKVAQGRDPHAEKAAARRSEAMTVEVLARRYLAAAELRAATRTEWERLVEVEITPALGTVPADRLVRGVIREWARGIAVRAPYVGNRAFEVLRRVYSWAVEEDVLAGSPFVGLKRPARERRGDRVLTEPELRALLVALDRVAGPQAEAVLLILLTVARRGMVLGMRRAELEQIDGREPRWVIPGPRMKSGRAHVVPLSPQALALVRRRLEASPGEQLFPPARARRAGQAPAAPHATATRWTLQAIRRAAQEALGATFPPWTLHCLRHTAATHLREDLGVRDDVVTALLAHAARGTADATPIYLRAELLAERRAALVAWAAWLDRLLAEAPGAKVLPMRRGARTGRSQKPGP